jgi:hypothetical protein
MFDTLLWVAIEFIFILVFYHHQSEFPAIAPHLRYCRTLTEYEYRRDEGKFSLTITKSVALDTETLSTEQLRLPTPVHQDASIILISCTKITMLEGERTPSRSD